MWFFIGVLTSSAVVQAFYICLHCSKIDGLKHQFEYWQKQCCEDRDRRWALDRRIGTLEKQLATTTSCQ